MATRDEIVSDFYTLSPGTYFRRRFKKEVCQKLTNSSFIIYYLGDTLTSAPFRSCELTIQYIKDASYYTVWSIVVIDYNELKLDDNDS